MKNSDREKFYGRFEVGDRVRLTIRNIHALRKLSESLAYNRIYDVVRVVEGEVPQKVFIKDDEGKEIGLVGGIDLVRFTPF